jgi:hypothetical protein
MKVDRITYKKVFPLSPFINEHLGVEMQVDEGDNVDEVMQAAKMLVHSWHNPQMVDVHAPPLEPVINLRDEPVINTIEDANSIEELSTLKKDLPTHLMPQYMSKLRELTEKIKQQF